VLVLVCSCGILYVPPFLPPFRLGTEDLGLLCLFSLSTASTSLLLPLEQKDLRTYHVLNFLKPLSMADIMPNPAEKRMACAARLDRRLNFPGGVPEALTKLDTTILTPKKRKLGEEQEYKLEKLYKVLRQALPRF